MSRWQSLYWNVFVSHWGPLCWIGFLLIVLHLQQIICMSDLCICFSPPSVFSPLPLLLYMATHYQIVWVRSRFLPRKEGDFPATVACLEVSLLGSCEAPTDDPDWNRDAIKTELNWIMLQNLENPPRVRLCQVRQGADFSQIPAAWGWFPASLSLRVSGVTFRSFEVSLCHAAFSCW